MAYAFAYVIFFVLLQPKIWCAYVHVCEHVIKDDEDCMTKSEILDKCIAFSVKINKLRKYLREKQHEYNNSDQIQRSGTSIGANYSEACDAESKADFIHKLGIAQKEANETIYWLKVLYGSELITKTQYDELLNDARELYRIIAASLKTLKMGNVK